MLLSLSKASVPDTGSDLGPRLVTRALSPFHGNVRCHYVANVDPADLQETVSKLQAATTAFII